MRKIYFLKIFLNFKSSIKVAQKLKVAKLLPLLYHASIFYNYTVILGPEAEQNSIIVISMAKWCPLENCTVLVLGSQYGIRLYDWDGSALFYKFDFVENGIGVDERQVTGKSQEFLNISIKETRWLWNFFRILQ